jgi:hypothetical protein
MSLIKYNALVNKGTSTIFLIYQFGASTNAYYKNLIDSDNYTTMECVMPDSYNKLADLDFDKIENNKLYLKINIPNQLKNIENEWIAIKKKRDDLLAQTDFAFLLDINKKYTTDSLSKMTTYRQALRDIAVTFKSPFKIVWPSKPLLVLK